MMTRQQVEVFLRIKNDPGLAEFRAWLDAALAECQQKLMFQTDDRAVHILQGRGQFAAELKTLIEQPEKLSGKGGR